MDRLFHVCSFKLFLYHQFGLQYPDLELNPVCKIKPKQKKRFFIFFYFGKMFKLNLTILFKLELLSFAGGLCFLQSWALSTNKNVEEVRLKTFFLFGEAYCHCFWFKHWTKKKHAQNWDNFSLELKKKIHLFWFVYFSGYHTEPSIPHQMHMASTNNNNNQAYLPEGLFVLDFFSWTKNKFWIYISVFLCNTGFYIFLFLFIKVSVNPVRIMYLIFLHLYTCMSV